MGQNLARCVYRACFGTSLKNEHQATKTCAMNSVNGRSKRVKVEVTCEQFYKKMDEYDNENLDYLGRRRSFRIKDRPKPKVQHVPEYEFQEENMEKKSEKIDLHKAESEYERLRLKNIEEKAALLDSLGIEETKQILGENQIRRPKAKNRILRPKQELPLRSPSLRLQNRSPEHVVPNYAETGTGALVKTHLEMENEENVEKTILGPLTMEQSYYKTKESLSLFLDDLNKLSCDNSRSHPASFKPADKSWFDSVSRMKITSDQVAKVVPARICSVAVHPSTSRLLAVAGDIYGHVGFWDMAASDELDGVHLFHPHTRNTSCIAFAPGHPERMYTSSYDGTVRCTDLDNCVFDEILHPDNPDDHWVSFLDFLSPYALCLSHGDGYIEVVDTRSRKEDRLLYEVTERRVKTVNVHPVQHHYVLTACNDGEVNMWDLRSMSSKPKPCSKLPHYKCVNSAFFSPVTGNLVLTSSMDNYIRLYDVTTLSAKHSPKTEIQYPVGSPIPRFTNLIYTTILQAMSCTPHNNQVGQWVTNFRPVWVPDREDCFIVGSRKQLRTIELYLSTGKLQQEFYGEELASICSINAFHPTQNILVCGNSSGRMFVFK